MPKFTKNEVDFESPAKGMDHCRDCVHVDPPVSCRIVAGLVKAGDWCDKFRKKSAMVKAFKR